MTLPAKGSTRRRLPHRARAVALSATVSLPRWRTRSAPCGYKTGVALRRRPTGRGWREGPGMAARTPRPGPGSDRGIAGRRGPSRVEELARFVCRSRWETDLRAGARAAAAAGAGFARRGIGCAGRRAGRDGPRQVREFGGAPLCTLIGGGRRRAGPRRALQRRAGPLPGLQRLLPGARRDVPPQRQPRARARRGRVRARRRPRHC